MASTKERPLAAHIAIGGNALGGVNQHLITLAPHLERQGFEVELVFLGEGSTPELARSRGIPTQVVQKGGRGDLLTILRLARLLRRRRPALVHTHTLSSNFYGRLAARLAGVPRCVTTVHSFMGDLLRYDPTGRLGNRLLFWQNQRMSRSADRLVAVSLRVREWLLASGMAPEKVSLIRCGIDLATGETAAQRREVRGRWGLEDDHWVIGNVARAHPVKDQMMLLEAGLPLLRADRRVRLVIVGEGPERHRLETRVKAERVDDQVLLPGAVPEAKQLMPGFDAFALSSRMEGISLALLEAMAAGRPVVATDVGGTREVVIHEVSGLLVPAGSADEMRRALMRMRSEPAYAARLAAAGRRVVEESYDAAATTAQLAALYRELLTSPAAARERPGSG